MRACFVALIVMVSILPAAADQVVMKNGDHLTGSIVKSDDKSLSIKTDYSDEITLKWDAVAEVTSSADVYVTSKAGQVLKGKIAMQGGSVDVQSSETGPTTLSRDAIVAIRSPEQERLYESWSGGVDLGYSIARGNSDVSNLSVGATADRTTLRDKTSVYFNSLLAKNRLNNVSITTANAVRGGLRYDYNVSDRAFLFAFTDLEHDRLQQLDLRNVLGGGLGYHFVKTERTTLDLNAGASFDQEFFTRLTRRSAELLAGDELTYKLSNGTLLKQRFTFFPNVSDLGQYRVLFDTAAVTKISRFLGWQITFSDRYLSNPLPGTKTNDVLLTTGVTVVFGGRTL